MELTDLLTALNSGERIEGGSPLHAAMHRISQEAMRITGELNSGYHEPARVRELLSALTGTQIDESVTLFPPLTADFGKNLRIGRDVFINSGCRFQDQGGITIGDRALIGHNLVVATLNHDMEPSRRADLVPQPVVIGSKVWIGANVTILPGVSIGDDAVIAAGALVTKDVPAGMLAMGSPARAVRAVSAE